MKTYKIDNLKISEYTKRNDSRALKTILIALATMPMLMFPMTKQEGAPTQLINYMIFSLLFTAIIIGFIYLNNKKLTKLKAENLNIIIDDNSITKVIDLNNEPLNFIHKMAYDRAKNIFGDFYAKIDYNKIKSVEKKNGDLLIMTTESNTFNGKNILLIPRELINFDDLEKEINSRRK